LKPDDKEVPEAKYSRCGECVHSESEVCNP
jgi:hypothetical protein